MTRYLTAATLALLAGACSLPQSSDAGSSDPAPRTIAVARDQIAAFEATQPGKRPPSIWKIAYKGKPAYLFISPCCDQFNYLYDSDGTRLCAPSGGISGGGDGSCPDALLGKEAKVVAPDNGAKDKTTAASAACEKGSKTVFSCLAARDKLIQVCDSGKTIDYSFGKRNLPPEIIVRAPRSDASTFQWAGVGRYLSYAVEVPNGNTTYSVFWGADRLTEAHAIEAGVNVEVNKKLVATVKCVGEKHIVQNIEGIDLKPIE